MIRQGNGLRVAIASGLLMFGQYAAAEWFKQQRAIMGTMISVELWHSSDSRARRCSDKVFGEMHRIDAAMSPYRQDSELSRLNRQAANKPVRISKELMQLLNKAQEMSRLTKGAFDITFASVGYLYDYRNRSRPGDREIANRLAAIDYRHIRLDEQAGTVSFKHKDVRIDLGGIAKGYAVDRGIEILQSCGIRRALVSAGGDSRIMGDRPVKGQKQGRPWMMGVRNPRNRKDVAVVLPLTDSAISTSGDYERFFIEDGKRHHHILSPKTGRSVANTWSATVIGSDATTTDALSTSLFVLGRQEGLKLMESLPGMDAIIIDATGQLHYSKGLLAPQKEVSKQHSNVL